MRWIRGPGFGAAFLGLEAQRRKTLARVTRDPGGGLATVTPLSMSTTCKQQSTFTDISLKLQERENPESFFALRYSVEVTKHPLLLTAHVKTLLLLFSLRVLALVLGLSKFRVSF